MLRIKSITPERFQDYGVVIEHPENSETAFNVIISDSENPWRIATYKIRDKNAKRLERHPYSHESFEPLEGLGILLVSSFNSPDDVEAFILDKPICLYKNIWHQLLSVTDTVVVKITENYDVTSEFHYFEEELRLGIIK